MTFKDYMVQGARYVGRVAERNWPYALGAVAAAAVIYTGNQDISDLLGDSSATTSAQWASSMMLTGKSIAALLLVTGVGEGIRSLYGSNDSVRENKGPNRNPL